MYNHKLVYVALALAILEVLSLFVLGYLHFSSNAYDFATLIKTLSITSALLQIAFFVIFIYYIRNQTRYVLLGTLSILLLLTFQPILFQSLGGGGSGSILADVNAVIGMALLVVAVNVHVDDTTYAFTKRILVANSFALMVFRTPVFFLLIWLIERFFDSTENIIVPVWIGVVALQYLTFAIINLFKTLIVNRIDFI